LYTYYSFTFSYGSAKEITLITRDQSDV